MTTSAESAAMPPADANAPPTSLGSSLPDAPIPDAQQGQTRPADATSTHPPTMNGNGQAPGDRASLGDFPQAAGGRDGADTAAAMFHAPHSHPMYFPYPASLQNTPGTGSTRHLPPYFPSYYPMPAGAPPPPPHPHHPQHAVHPGHVAGGFFGHPQTLSTPMPPNQFYPPSAHQQDQGSQGHVQRQHPQHSQHPLYDSHTESQTPTDPNHPRASAQRSPGAAHMQHRFPPVHAGPPGMYNQFMANAVPFHAPAHHPPARNGYRNNGHQHGAHGASHGAGARHHHTPGGRASSPRRARSRSGGAGGHGGSSHGGGPRRPHSASPGRNGSGARDAGHGRGAHGNSSSGGHRNNAGSPGKAQGGSSPTPNNGDSGSSSTDVLVKQTAALNQSASEAVENSDPVMLALLLTSWANSLKEAAAQEGRFSVPDTTATASQGVNDAKTFEAIFAASHAFETVSEHVLFGKTSSNTSATPTPNGATEHDDGGGAKDGGEGGRDDGNATGKDMSAVHKSLASVFQHVLYGDSKMHDEIVRLAVVAAPSVSDETRSKFARVLAALKVMLKRSRDLQSSVAMAPRAARPSQIQNGVLPTAVDESAGKDEEESSSDNLSPFEDALLEPWRRSVARLQSELCAIAHMREELANMATTFPASSNSKEATSSVASAIAAFSKRAELDGEDPASSARHQPSRAEDFLVNVYTLVSDELERDIAERTKVVQDDLWPELVLTASAAMCDRVKERSAARVRRLDELRSDADALLNRAESATPAGEDSATESTVKGDTEIVDSVKAVIAEHEKSVAAARSASQDLHTMLDSLRALGVACLNVDVVPPKAVLVQFSVKITTAFSALDGIHDWSPAAVHGRAEARIRRFIGVKPKIIRFEVPSSAESKETSTAPAQDAGKTEGQSDAAAPSAGASRHRPRHVRMKSSPDELLHLHSRLDTSDEDEDLMGVVEPELRCVADAESANASPAPAAPVVGNGHGHKDSHYVDSAVRAFEAKCSADHSAASSRRPASYGGKSATEAHVADSELDERGIVRGSLAARKAAFEDVMSSDEDDGMIVHDDDEGDGDDEDDDDEESDAAHTPKPDGANGSAPEGEATGRGLHDRSLGQENGDLGTRAEGSSGMHSFRRFSLGSSAADDDDLGQEGDLDAPHAGETFASRLDTSGERNVAGQAADDAPNAGSRTTGADAKPDTGYLVDGRATNDDGGRAREARLGADANAHASVATTGTPTSEAMDDEQVKPSSAMPPRPSGGASKPRVKFAEVDSSDHAEAKGASDDPEDASEATDAGAAGTGDPMASPPRPVRSPSTPRSSHSPGSAHMRSMSVDYIPF